MKILQILQRPQRRGAEIFACQLAAFLQQRGHVADILFLFGAPPAKLDFDLPFFHLEASESMRLADLAAYRKLARFVRKGKYDLVQANAGDTLKYATLSRKLFGWHHTPLVFRNANKISDFVNTASKRILYQQLLIQVDYVASVSENCRLDFLDTFRFPESNIRTLPIGTSTELAAPYKSWEETGLPITAEDQVCIQSGGLVSEKNHSWTIAQMRAWVKLFPRLRLLFCGEGSLRADLEKQSHEAGLTNRIIFAGNRPDAVRILPLCHALIMPSLIEGLPAVILEAMATGVPVIANDAGGINEVVIHNQTGYLIPPNNAILFAEALTAVLTKPDPSITEKARRQIGERYNLDNVCSRFEASYREWRTAKV